MAPTIVFDLDGVLIDSRPGIIACVNQTLAEGGIEPFDSKHLEQIIGPPLHEGFATLLHKRGADRSLTPSYVARFRELYATACLAGGTLLQPGASAMLVALQTRAILAIATSKPLRFADPILRELGIRKVFAVVAGPGEGTGAEDKRETLGRALAELAPFDRTRTWMIGDRHHDIRAAAEHDIQSIGVTWGFGSEEELRGAGAFTVVRTPEELLAFFGTASSLA